MPVILRTTNPLLRDGELMIAAEMFPFLSIHFSLTKYHLKRAQGRDKRRYSVSCSSYDHFDRSSVEKRHRSVAQLFCTMPV
jgi:hypothetical protein